MTEQDGEVERWRAEVAQGHEAVAQGRYDDAIAAFARSLVALGKRLGETHPEVEELAQDLQAVMAMKEVAGFGQQVGYRWDDLGAAAHPTSDAAEE